MSCQQKRWTCTKNKVIPFLVCFFSFIQNDWAALILIPVSHAVTFSHCATGWRVLLVWWLLPEMWMSWSQWPALHSCIMRSLPRVHHQKGPPGMLRDNVYLHCNGGPTLHYLWWSPDPFPGHMLLHYYQDCDKQWNPDQCRSHEQSPWQQPCVICVISWYKPVKTIRECACQDWTQHNSKGKLDIIFSMNDVLHLSWLVLFSELWSFQVNGAEASLPTSAGTFGQVTRQGSYIVFDADDFIVQFDGRSTLLVRIGQQYQNRVTGMCGNFNGDPTDDKALPNGTLAQNDNHFGNSWKSPMSQARSDEHSVKRQNALKKNAHI